MFSGSLPSKTVFLFTLAAFPAFTFDRSPGWPDSDLHWPSAGILNVLTAAVVLHSILLSDHIQSQSLKPAEITGDSSSR